MFSFRRGYEIDGSDMSYSVILPERAKCAEVLRFILSLKVIDRRTPFRVCTKKKHREYSIRRLDKTEFEVAYDDLARLDEAIHALDLVSCEIDFAYQPPNTLHPEVRRDVVDIVARAGGMTGRTWTNPVFADEYGGSDGLYLALTERGSENLVCQTESGQSAAYRAALGATPPFALEIGVALGAPFGCAAYIVERVAARFPELEIEAGRIVREMYELEGFYPTDREIFERIDLPTGDFSYTLRRLVREGGLRFVTRKRQYRPEACAEETSTEAMLLPHIPDWIGEYDPTANNALASSPGWNILKLLTGGKNIMTLDAYVHFIERLWSVRYFPGRDFTRYSSVWMKCDEGDARGILRCVRDSARGEHFRAVLDVPYLWREEVVRRLGLR